MQANFPARISTMLKRHFSMGSPQCTSDWDIIDPMCQAMGTSADEGCLRLWTGIHMIRCDSTLQPSSSPRTHRTPFLRMFQLNIRLVNTPHLLSMGLWCSTLKKKCDLCRNIKRPVQSLLFFSLFFFFILLSFSLNPLSPPLI